MKKCKKYVFVDIETSGLNEKVDDIIRFTAMRSEGDCLLFDELAKPRKRIDSNVEVLTGIRREDLEYRSASKEVRSRFLSFIKGYIVISKNITFVEKFLGVIFEDKIELMDLQ